MYFYIYFISVFLTEYKLVLNDIAAYIYIYMQGDHISHTKLKENTKANNS